MMSRIIAKIDPSFVHQIDSVVWQLAIIIYGKLIETVVNVFFPSKHSNSTLNFQNCIKISHTPHDIHSNYFFPPK